MTIILIIIIIMIIIILIIIIIMIQIVSTDHVAPHASHLRQAEGPFGPKPK